MKLLSIQWGTNSTAALLVDGEIVACVSQERFSRIKNDESYPRHAIEAVLEIGGLDATDLDAVVFADFTFCARELLIPKSQWSVHDRLREQTHFWKPKLLKGEDVSYLDVFRDKLDFEQDGGDWKQLASRLSSDGLNVDDSVGQDFRRQAVFAHLGIDFRKIHFVNHH